MQVCEPWAWNFQRQIRGPGTQSVLRGLPEFECLYVAGSKRPRGRGQDEHRVAKGLVSLNASNLPALVQAQLATFTPLQQQHFWSEYERRAKSTSTGYLLWAACGWHYAYLGMWGWQVVYWLSGGGLAIWMVADLFRVPSLVRARNADIAIQILRDLAAIQGGQGPAPVQYLPQPAPASPTPAIPLASLVEITASDSVDAAVKEAEPKGTIGSESSGGYWLSLPGSSAVEGPFQRADLQHRFASGAITEATMVCAIGGQEWVPIHTIAAASETAETAPVLSPGDPAVVVNTASERQPSASTVEDRADGPNVRNAPLSARIFGLLAGILGAAVAVALIGLGAVIMVASQTDKAEPEFIAARSLEKGDDVQKTVAAFESARAADPTSKCGKRAAEKLIELKPKYDAWKQAEDARQRQAEATRIQRMRIRVRRSYFSEEPDSSCTGKGLPPYHWDYSGGTYSEDDEVAAADGCRALYSMGGQNTDFCCPKSPSPLGF